MTGFIVISTGERSRRFWRVAHPNVKRTMPSRKVSSDSTTALFGIVVRATTVIFGFVGLILGGGSLGFVDQMFYTTKPHAFLAGWHQFLIIGLYVVSVALIPFAARRSRIPVVDSVASWRGRLVWFIVTWVCIAVLMAFMVSVIAATIHHRTLSIPDWLISGGLMLVPVLPGIVVLIIGRWIARSHEPRSWSLLALAMILTLGGCGRGGFDEAARLASQASTDQAEGRFEEAFQKLEQAVILRPDVAEYHTGLGMVAVRLGAFDVAEEHYLSAEHLLAEQTQANPERIPDHVFCLALLGRPAEAMQVLTNGIARYPDLQNLQQLESSFDSLLAGVSEYAITNVEPVDASE